MNINSNGWNKIRYSAYQPFYDIIAKYFRPFRSKSIESLHIKSNDKVLIVGAGTGLDLEFLVGNKNITAIDITPSMLARLERRANKLGIEVTALVMDGSKLDFEEETFDIVILHLIVAVIPDAVSCLQETERVLKTKGKFTIMDKFLEPGSLPSFFRKILNPIFIFLATSITRDIDKLLSKTSLIKERHEKLGSIFWLVQGKKS